MDAGPKHTVSARRPFLAELSVMARRRDVEGARVGRLYDTSTGLLDRLLLAFIAAHEAATAPGVAEPAVPPVATPVAEPHEARRPR